MDGQERRAAKTLMDYWQLILVAVGGIVGAITFYNQVRTVVEEQRAFKATVEDRRTRTRDEMEAIRIKIAVQEKEIEWLKKR